MTGQAAQLLIDERNTRLERMGVSLVPGLEQRREILTWLGDEATLS